MSTKQKVKLTKAIAICKKLKDGLDQILLTSKFEEVTSYKPSLVINDDFLQAKIQDGVVMTLAIGIPFEATNDEFMEYLKESEGDIDLAVDSFCSLYKIRPTGKIISAEELEKSGDE